MSQRQTVIKTLVEERNKNMNICNVIARPDITNMFFVPQSRNNGERTNGTLFLPTNVAEMEIEAMKDAIRCMKCASIKAAC